MKHPSTRALYAYWDEKRGGRPAPDRADIDPAAIRHALGDTFMLAADFVDWFVCAWPVRASARCSAARSKARPSRAVGRTEPRQDRGLIASSIGGRGSGRRVTGQTTDSSGSIWKCCYCRWPMSAMPHPGGWRAGAVVPPYWLGEKPVVEMEFGTCVISGGTSKFGRAPFPGTRPEGRRRHDFVVYSGGRRHRRPANGPANAPLTIAQ